MYNPWEKVVSKCYKIECFHVMGKLYSHLKCVISVGSDNKHITNISWIEVKKSVKSVVKYGLHIFQSTYILYLGRDFGGEYA